MTKKERRRIIKMIMWDYNISIKDIEELIIGKRKYAGHYSREKLFVKIIQSLPWFTILQLFSISDIRNLLSDEIIKSIRHKSLQNKYRYVKERLQEIVPVTG